MDTEYQRIILWGAGLFFTAINTWMLFIIRTIKSDHKDLTTIMRENEKDHVSSHSKMHEKINTVERRMDQDFVHKDHLNELKADVKNGFKEIKQLIEARIN